MLRIKTVIGFTVSAKNTLPRRFFIALNSAGDWKTLASLGRFPIGQIDREEKGILQGIRTSELANERILREYPFLEQQRHEQHLHEHVGCGMSVHGIDQAFLPVQPAESEPSETV